MLRASSLRFLVPSRMRPLCRTIRRIVADTVAAWLRHSDEWRPDPRVTIGKHTYGVGRATIPILTAGTRIDVGKYCSVAKGVVFVVGRHFVENISTYPFRAFLVAGGKPDDENPPVESIVVGNDVWIGARALIVANVTIGHGAVVAAGSVVVKDVPPYAVVGGAPARVIRMRFGPERIQELLEIAWWDWPDERILSNLDLFYGDPDQFVQANRLR